MNKNYQGIIITILISIFFLFFSVDLIKGVKKKKHLKLDKATISQNEISTYLNLKKIVTAQKKYIEKDQNGDNFKTYSQFLIQLYRVVTEKGEYINIKLIDRELAFAMGPALAVNGYYFEDLYKKKNPNGNSIHLDYKQEWAMAAFPANYSKTGFLTFIVNQDGKIWAKDTGVLPTEFLLEPQKLGWKEISGRNILEQLQKEKK